MELTHEQKNHLLIHGYVHVPGVVPRIMVDRALQEINHSVGQGMDKDDMSKFRSLSYCSEIQSSPAITGLLNDTPALQLAESVIGEGNLRRASSAQIALRFPGLQDPPKPSSPHLDGMYSPTNGVKKGTIGNFTALMGVLLNDLPNPNAGNFTVWPGTHHLYEKYFQENGPEALMNGMPPIDIPEPVQIIGKAGDVVLVHYLVGHAASLNVSPHVRYACFFRLYHADHKETQRKSMTDKWMHWPGIQEIVE